MMWMKLKVRDMNKKNVEKNTHWSDNDKKGITNSFGSGVSMWCACLKSLVNFVDDGIRKDKSWQNLKCYEMKPIMFVGYSETRSICSCLLSTTHDLADETMFKNLSF